MLSRVVGSTSVKVGKFEGFGAALADLNRTGEHEFLLFVENKTMGLRLWRGGHFSHRRYGDGFKVSRVDREVGLGQESLHVKQGGRVNVRQGREICLRELNSVTLPFCISLLRF